jgi:hypothetical protein
MDKLCGNCNNHFDLYGMNEKAGVRNCMALPFPLVLGILSTADARCNLPALFTPILAISPSVRDSDALERV